LDTFDAIQNRQSVRSYLPTPVPKKLLARILEAARLAPSAANRQPWHFIIVKGIGKRKAIAKSGLYSKFLVESPVVIVGCGDKEISPKWYAIDTSIALENIVIAATSEGLGTCWIGSFEEATVKELLKIPKRYSVVALLTLGYPNEGINLNLKNFRSPRKRKKLEDITSLEEFGTPLQTSATP
jgi:nitroreductase